MSYDKMMVETECEWFLYNNEKQALLSSIRQWWWNLYY